jgi:hypothetical protein
MADKPTTAFVLSLIGGIFIILGGLVYMVVFSILGGLFSFIGFGGLGIGLVALGVLGLIWGILVIVGAIMMNSGNPARVRTGSILVLIFSILSWFGAAGGFFIGFLLGLIGAILGFAWKPERPPMTVPPPP